MLPANVHAIVSSVQPETDSESYETSSLPADERPTMAEVMRDLEADAQWVAECEARDDADWAEMMERHDRLPSPLPEPSDYFAELEQAIDAFDLADAPSVAEAVAVTTQPSLAKVQPTPRDFTREIRACCGFIASIKLVAEHAEHERSKRAAAVR